jgi:hypothetical protein
MFLRVLQVNKYDNAAAFYAERCEYVDEECSHYDSGRNRDLVNGNG